MARFRIEYIARAYATAYVEAEDIDEAGEKAPNVDELTFTLDDLCIENEVIEEESAIDRHLNKFDQPQV